MDIINIYSFDSYLYFDIKMLMYDFLESNSKVYH